MRIICAYILICVSTSLHSQEWNRLNNGAISGGGEQVTELALFNDSLFIMGGFSDAGGNAAEGIAIYDSLTWNVIVPGITGSADIAIVYQGMLAVAGNILNVGGVSSNDELAFWDGSTWSANHNGDNQGDPTDMAIFNGDLIVTGPEKVNSVTGLSYVAQWNGSAWTDVGGGLSGGTTAGLSCAVLEGDLFVGGRFFIAGSVSAQNIARWDGVQWHNVGDADGEPISMLVDSVNGYLYVGGWFSTIGGTSAIGIARYDGANWYNMGDLDLVGASDMVFYQNQLYAAGGFTQAGGNTSIQYVARFDGNNWQSMTTGTDQTCFALEAYKNELYVGGGFTTAGDTIVSGLARWSFPEATACSEMYAGIASHPDTLYTSELPYTFRSASYGNGSIWWDFGNGHNDSMGHAIYHWDSVPGTYPIYLVADCGAESDTAWSQVVIIDNVGVDEIVIEGTPLNAYPNPASSSVNLEFAEFDQEGWLRIYTTTGELVYEVRVDEPDDQTTIDASSWGSGTYIGRIEGQSKIGTVSFIVE